MTLDDLRRVWTQHKESCPDELSVQRCRRVVPQEVLVAPASRQWDWVERSGQRDDVELFRVLRHLPRCRQCADRAAIPQKWPTAAEARTPTAFRVSYAAAPSEKRLAQEAEFKELGVRLEVFRHDKLLDFKVTCLQPLQSVTVFRIHAEGFSMRVHCDKYDSDGHLHGFIRAVPLKDVRQANAKDELPTFEVERA